MSSTISTGSELARLSDLRLVVFDFDGTLCDSADIKTSAFRALYLDEQGEDFANAVQAYHLAHAGLPRYDKIRFIESTMLGRNPTEARVTEVADRFSLLVEDAVVDAPLFAGVVSFLEAFHTNVLITIASATPTSELRSIVGRKQLGKYFAAIDGSPRSKADNLRAQAARFSVKATEVVMVGDQPSDAAAARSAGTQGIMIAQPAPWTAPFARVDTFADATALIAAALDRR